MNILRNIWYETDAEKRDYLWKHFIQQTDVRLKKMKLSPTYKTINQLQYDLESLVYAVTHFSGQQKRLSGIDFENKKLLYNYTPTERDIQQRAKEIETDILPVIHVRKDTCYALKDYVYENVNIHTVGIEKLYNKEGYVFIKNSIEAEVYTYYYYKSNYVNSKQRSIIHLKYIDRFAETLSTTLNWYKMQLNKQYNTALNSYLVESSLDLPLEQTLLPIAKGKLTHHLRFSV